MTEAEVQQALAALAQLGAAAGNSRAGIQSVGQSMARLRMEMQRGTGTIQSNTQALQRLMSDFDSLDSATKRSTAGQAMLAEQTKMASDIMKNAVGSMSSALLKGGIIEAVDYFRNQFFTSIKSFQDNVSGTEAVFRSQNAALESQIRVLDRLSQGATVAAETLAMIPNPAARFGAALSAGVAVAADFASGLSKDTAKALQILQTEVSQNVIAYQTMTKAGMAFENGISDARKGSQDLRLSLNELTKIVANNKNELIQFGGSVTGGYVRLRNLGSALNKLEDEGENLREQLYRIGYSYEDQVQGQIEYMTLMQQSGQLDKKTQAELARESTNYLVNLKAISAYTGEDAKSARARAQAASEQLAVQAKLRQSSDPQAMEKFQAMIKLMPADMQKGIQQMTAFDGTIIDKNLNILLSQSPTRKRVLEEAQADLENKTLSTADLQARQQERMKKYGAQLEKEALAMGSSLGAVNLATGQYGEVVAMGQNQVKEGQKGQTDLFDHINQVGEKIGTTAEQFAMLKDKGTDPLLESTVALDTTFRNQAAKFSEIQTGVLTQYMTQGAPKSGIPTMLEQQQKQFNDTLKLMEGLGFLVEIPPAWKIVREEGARVTEGTAAVAASLKEVASSLAISAQELTRAAASLSTIPQSIENKPVTGAATTLPTTAQLAEGKPATGTDTTLSTPLLTTTVQELSKAATSLSTTSNLVEGRPGTQPTPAMPSKKGPEAVIPLNSDSINIAFKNPSSFLENKKEKPDTRQDNIDQVISNLFNSPNLMTTSLSELKNIISSDSQISQSLMKQYTDKMDTLISTLQDNVDYSKRIADNIA